MVPLYKMKAFVAIWIAQAAAALGSTFAVFIISWLMYELTGSKMAMGMTWITFMVPSLLTGLFSGPYLDRINRKYVMIFSEWSRAVVFLIPLILLPLGMLEVWHLYFVTLIMGIAEPLFRPSSMAYVAQILPKDRLMKGNSLLEGTMQMMMLVGPALGGVLMASFGASTVLIILVSALGVSGFVLLFIPNEGQIKNTKKDPWIVQFKEGIRFYRSFPVLFWIGILLMVTNFSSGAAQPMFLPYVLENLNGNETQYGLYMSAFPVGMLLGSFVTGIVKQPKNLRRVMLGSLTVNGVFLGLLGWTSNFWVAVALTVCTGFFAMVFTINNTTFYQKRVPDEVRGRVFTVRTLLAQAGIPVGAALGGIFAEVWSLTALFTVLGLIVLVATTIAWNAKIFYHLNDDVPEEKKISPLQPAVGK
ncbi:MFS transporter [Alkalihalobacterium bogoriense]|uniref:MFS transporter n=1 Tax=Alkalihalobacterium bogoriense TaxID=246272 RepID=UPI0004792E5F|nr:MFS transporter [Alkalihalobacterium bogoriense]